MEGQFPRWEKKLGFGCMRLPMAGDEIDLEGFRAMVDAFLAAGFNYFDTAHGYHSGKSESAVRAALTSRYPRERYVLTDKLSGGFFQREEDIRPLFRRQLAACGVDYFDFYLMHAQNRENFQKYRACRAYEIAFALREEGLVRHVGISFHDTADVLEDILTQYPQLEVVQLQFNYADYEDPAVQSRKCYEVCRKYGKPVIVMEPVKGGGLARDLPAAGRAELEALGGGSPASYAIRFAAGFEGVMMVLSGMSDMDQLRENVGFMGDFHPLTQAERAAVDRVAAILRGEDMIPCTACRYCVDGCPKAISIPDLFACMNAKRRYEDWNADYYYSSVYTKGRGKAGDCVKCGKCEAVCPQRLNIRELLTLVSREFDGREETGE